MDPIVLAGGFIAGCIIGAIVMGVVNLGKYLFEITHGGYGPPAASSWGSLYLNMGWGVVWGVIALGLFLGSALKRRINAVAPIAAVLAIVFGGIVATHFAHKVGVSSPWWSL
jgi:hypothetical protein